MVPVFCLFVCLLVDLVRLLRCFELRGGRFLGVVAMMMGAWGVCCVCWHFCFPGLLVALAHLLPLVGVAAILVVGWR